MDDMHASARWGWVFVLMGLSCAGDAASNDGPAGGTAGGVANESPSTRDQAATTDAGSCGWPSNLADLGSASREVCRATRAFLQCEIAGGGGLICASDDFTRCAHPVGTAGAPANCDSTCEADEYVALCGGIGAGSVPEPPVGCRRGSLIIPGGIAIHCCPCDAPG